MDIGDGLELLRFRLSGDRHLRHQRAREELGYKPEYDLERGIADYLAALKQLGV